MEALVHPSYRDSSLYSTSFYIQRKNYLPLDYLVRPFKALTYGPPAPLPAVSANAGATPPPYQNTRVIRFFLLHDVLSRLFITSSLIHSSFSFRTCFGLDKYFAVHGQIFGLFLFLDNAPRLRPVGRGWGRGWGRGGKNIAHEGGACDLGLGDLHCDKILKWQSAVTWSQARECCRPKTLLSLQNCVWTNL